jgi:hypothetical protein
MAARFAVLAEQPPHRPLTIATCHAQGITREAMIR